MHKNFALITNPIVNSYKRLVPGYEAPCYISWSDANRSTMIRIPASRGKATRIEVRSVDPSANPYLAMAALCRAGLDGIISDLPTLSPVKKNLFKMTDKERQRLGIKNLPESLLEAIHNFSKSELMKETIGNDLFDKLIEAKQKEWDEYNYDYSEVARIYATQLTLIENAIQKVLPEANSFVSTELDISFNDILVELDLIRNIDLNNMNALINTFLLTKNINRSITRLEYNNEIKELELAKEQQILDNIKDAIANYPGSEQTIIIPGFEGSINTITYLQVLFDQLLISQRSIAELEQDIAFNESRIVLYRAQQEEVLDNDSASQEALNELTEANTGLLDTTNVLVNILVTNTNTLLEEYNLIVVSNIATSLTSPTVEEGFNTLLFAAIGLVLGGMVSLGVVFVNHTMKEYKKQKQA
jgi:hypothetical protein